MFIGHYGIAFAIKQYKKNISLGFLFIAVQLLDIAFFIFLQIGLEHAKIIPSYTKFNPYDLYDLPFTHSLLGAVIWSALTYFLVYSFFQKGENEDLSEIKKTAFLLSLAVFSHWILDFFVHTPDLLLIPGINYKVGLGLWNYPLIATSLELSILIAGFLLFFLKFHEELDLKKKIITGIFLLLLIGTAIATPHFPIPKSNLEFSITGLSSYLFFAIIAFLYEYYVLKNSPIGRPKVNVL